jgi:adenylate cyclase class 2
MIEFEITIPGIDIEDARQKLRQNGATLEKESHIQKHIVFNMPLERRIKGSWMRVREEADRLTMSLKIIDGGSISDQKEFFFIAQSTEDACRFFQMMGAEEKAHQEKRREIWQMGECEVTIDEWPFLEPFMEVEGPDESSVRDAVERLGYDYGRGKVCAVGTLYSEKYGIPEDIINNHTPLITFDMTNPFEML